MRNFLNSTFKCISRSLVVAAIFLIVGTSVVFGQQAQISSFNSTKSEVLPTESFVLRWASSQTTRCSIEAKLNGDIVDSRDGLPATDNVGQDFNNDEEGEYTYTLICISSLLSGPRSVEKNLQIKVKPATQVGTKEECLADGNSLEVCTLCENYPRSGLCQICLEDSTSQTCQSFVNQCQNGDDSDANQCEFTQGQLARLADEAGDTNAIPPAQQSSECGFTNLKQCALDLFDNTVLPLFTGFLRLCSVIFELAVWIGIVKFSVLVGTGPDAWIVAIWSTVRDILNIGVIFVLLYAAINVIVGRGGEIKKLIAGVILFGVLTNFSLFLTRAAVDVSNVIALEFYNQMRTEDSISSISFNRGLGATVVEITGLVKFYSKDVDGGVSDEIKTRSKIQDSFMFRFGMIIVFIAVGFMFLQAAFIFIARTVSLVFLLIFSPLMFAGGIFSPIKSWIEKWHKEFLGQIILAPVFFILLYVALTILHNVTNTLNTELTKLNNVGEDYLLPFSIIILTSGLVIFSFSLAVTKAKEYAGSIGGKAASYGNRMGGFILGKGVGGAASITARLGQQTLGRLGDRIDQGTGLMARTGQFLRLNKMKDASFDIRNAPGTAKVGQGINKILSTATGAPVAVTAGAALKGRETRKKEAAEVVQKKADSKIEQKFQEIDKDVKKYEITDQEIINAAGEKITRGAENDEAWEKKVRVANTTSKKAAQRKKEAYLATLTTTSRSTTEKGKAEFRAKKAAEEKLEKSKKADQDYNVYKSKLKAYTDDLANVFASDAAVGDRLTPPLDTVRLAKRKAEIQKMTDREIIDEWGKVRDQIFIIQDRFEGLNRTILRNPNDGLYEERSNQLRVIKKQAGKANGARLDMEHLRVRIENHEKNNSL